MINSSHIDLDSLLKKLFYAFAFLVPFEKILEFLFDIDTVLKPYRVIALVIFFVFGLRSIRQWTPNKQARSDLFLYLLFVYGVIITAFKMISTSFNMAYFQNDAFQIVLYLGLFVVARQIQIEIKEIRRIFLALVIGSTINAIFVFNNFFILKIYTRNTGFMDNPNYFALSLVVSLLLIIAWRAYIKTTWAKILALVAFLLLIAVLTISGSRTGFAILVLGVGIQFYFSSLKEKRVLLGLGLVLAIPILIVGSNFMKESGPLILINRLQKVSSEDNRIPIWKGVLRASEDTAFMGMGVGQFKGNFQKYFVGENNDLIRRMLERNYFLSPHSDYLAVLVIYGIIGLVCYLAFLGISLLNLLHQIRNSFIDYIRIHYQYALVILVVLLLFGITQENFISPLFWLLLSFSTKLGEVDQEELKFEME